MSHDVAFQLAGPAKPIILVPVVLSGRGPYQFALDTGAGVTVVSSDLADALGLERGGTKDALGAGGRIAVSTTSLEWIGVGSARVEDLPVVIADLSTLAAAMGQKLDGILGYNFLQRFRVVIDYPGSTLRLD